MRGRILAGVVAGLLLVQPARADLPVIDAASLAKWVAQAQQMAQQLTQLENTVRSLTDVPQNLVNQVEGLLQQAVQNPLGNINAATFGQVTNARDPRIGQIAFKANF